jgi:hypothetical protein
VVVERFSIVGCSFLVRLGVAHPKAFIVAVFGRLVLLLCWCWLLYPCRIPSKALVPLPLVGILPPIDPQFSFLGGGSSLKEI